MGIAQRKPKKGVLQIDGRTLEGGGQLIRNAICLSALTGIPIEINNIRGNRTGGGGLRNQHLACVKWLAHASRARVEGAEKGSKILLFEPGAASGLAGLNEHSPAFKKVTQDGRSWYECRLDIDTAGSTGLALQAILPFILFSELPSALPIRLVLAGGTNVSASPSYDYIAQVLLPTLNNLGFPAIEAHLHRRGWSHGSISIGSLSIDIPARRSVILPAFNLGTAPGEVPHPSQRRPIHVHATFLAPDSCHSQLTRELPDVLHRIFGESFAPKLNTLTTVCESSGHSKRMYLLLVATVTFDQAPASSVRSETPYSTLKLGRDWLYDRKITSHTEATTQMIERVTADLASEIASGAAVDSFMRDQLIIFQALANGTTIVLPGIDDNGRPRAPSLHAQTAAWIAEMMLKVKFDREGRCSGPTSRLQLDGGSSSAVEELERSLAMQLGDRLNLT